MIYLHNAEKPNPQKTTIRVHNSKKGCENVKNVKTKSKDGKIIFFFFLRIWII